MHATKLLSVCAFMFVFALGTRVFTQTPIGKELSVPFRLADGEEFELSLDDLVAHGRRLFAANWTVQEGGGRPLTKGTGSLLVTPGLRLEFPRNFNRVSAPEANSCAGATTHPLAS